MMADDARDHLAKEQERLEGVKASLEADGIGTESESENLSELSDADQHQADTGTETFERERDFSILEQVEGELHDIERALQRLDDGTYGQCEFCNQPIDPERLEAMPAARFCVEHQTLAEHPPGRLR
jgi:RNA polymerase-binding transcription factor DksA